MSPQTIILEIPFLSWDSWHSHHLMRCYWWCAHFPVCLCAFAPPGSLGRYSNTIESATSDIGRKWLCSIIYQWFLSKYSWAGKQWSFCFPDITSLCAATHQMLTCSIWVEEQYKYFHSICICSGNYLPWF